MCHEIHRNCINIQLICCTDFVNALADPKRYTSLAQERADLMRNMGIDDVSVAFQCLISSISRFVMQEVLDENGRVSDSTDSGSGKVKLRSESEVSRNTTGTSNMRNVSSEPGTYSSD